MFLFLNLNLHRNIVFFFLIWHLHLSEVFLFMAPLWNLILYNNFHCLFPRLPNFNLHSNFVLYVLLQRTPCPLSTSACISLFPSFSTASFSVSTTLGSVSSQSISLNWSIRLPGPPCVSFTPSRTSRAYTTPTLRRDSDLVVRKGIALGVI